MDFEQARTWVEQANQKAGEMGLEAMSHLMNGLNNPQDRLHIIHVGGTNGKGSICSYIAYILASAGYRVGRYISPTIYEYRERIQTLEYENGQPVVRYISEQDYVELVQKSKVVYDKLEQENHVLPSAFELETGISFCYFKKQKCDFVLLEVGMGGRRDATNIISHSECTVFASISMDHMNILGDALEKIVKEKSGIIKPQGTVVTYDYGWLAKENKESDITTPILRQVTEKQEGSIVSADFSKIGEEKHSLQGITFSYKTYENLQITLLGENQTKNVAVAIEVIERLQEKGYEISREDIYKGIKETRWDGRFQVIWNHPYYIVDGAHNVDAAKSLKKSISMYLKEKRLLFVVGILADKEYQKIMALLGPYAEKIITITPDNPRALSAQELQQVALQYCSCVEVGENVEKALTMVQKEEKNYDAVLIFGSLYYLHSVFSYMEKRKKHEEIEVEKFL